MVNQTPRPPSCLVTSITDSSLRTECSIMSRLDFCEAGAFWLKGLSNAHMQAILYLLTSCCGLAEACRECPTCGTRASVHVTRSADCFAPQVPPLVQVGEGSLQAWHLMCCFFELYIKLDFYQIASMDESMHVVMYIINQVIPSRLVITSVFAGYWSRKSYTFLIMFVLLPGTLPPSMSWQRRSCSVLYRAKTTQTS